MLVDLVALPAESRRVGRPTEVSRHAHHPVHRHPGHQATVGEFLLSTACLPDALFRRVPVGHQPVHHLAELCPALMTHAPGSLVGVIDRVHQLAVNVELTLVGSSISNTHRAGSTPALEVVERVLVEIAGAVDSVHDPERRAAFGMVEDPLPCPAQKLDRFVAIPEGNQGIHGEAGVADPGVAVVPIALASDELRQSRRQGSDGRPRRGIGEHPQGHG